MEKMINTLGTQARELMNSPIIKDMLNACQNDTERCELLAVASMYALLKAN